MYPPLITVTLLTSPVAPLVTVNVAPTPDSVVVVATPLYVLFCLFERVVPAVLVKVKISPLTLPSIKYCLIKSIEYELPRVVKSVETASIK